jgi:hypothetical protein
MPTSPMRLLGLMAVVGKCQTCKGAGQVPRPPDADGKQSKMPMLCPRCQGGGQATLAPEERSADFSRREVAGGAEAMRRANETGQRSSNRGFKSGIDDAKELRRRRDEIRRVEGRTAPPCEPAPDSVMGSVIGSVTSSVTDITERCPCGVVAGECNGVCFE